MADSATPWSNPSVLSVIVPPKVALLVCANATHDITKNVMTRNTAFTMHLLRAILKLRCPSKSCPRKKGPQVRHILRQHARNVSDFLEFVSLNGVGEKP